MPSINEIEREADLEIIAREVLAELSRAQAKFPPLNSAHEGYSVILEELDELWDEVKRHAGPERTANMRRELIQVAAMALRFIYDVTDATDEWRFLVVWNQPGPLKVMDEKGTIWMAYKEAKDIPNLNSGPHIAEIWGRLVPDGGEET